LAASSRQLAATVGDGGKDRPAMAAKWMESYRDAKSGIIYYAREARGAAGALQGRPQGGGNKTGYFGGADGR
jgi:hypothetical protein